MRFKETTYLTSADQVDVENGILNDVKFLGLDSLNGRRYTAEAVRNAVELYAGRKVYIDHGDDGTPVRGYRDWVGKTRRPIVREDGIYGQVKFKEEHSEFKCIMADAKENPKDFGFSHVADGESTIAEDGVEEVRVIEEVFSVDLVTDPATTAGLFESKSNTTKTPERRTMKLSISEILKRTVGNVPRIGRLKEMVDDGTAPEEMAVEVAEEASPEDQVKSAILAAIVAKLENASDDQFKAVMAALDMEDSITGNAGGGEGSEGGESGEGEEPKSEAFTQLKQRVAMAECRSSFAEAGITPNDAQLQAATLVSVKQRAELIESWRLVNHSGVFREEFRPSQSPPANGNTGPSEGYANRFQEAAKKALAAK